MIRTTTVLFVCADNASSSIMAESILRGVGGARFIAFSAGPAPAQRVDATVQDCLRGRHMPVAGLHPKSWSRFAGEWAPQLDFVVTLCDRAAAHPMPVWHGDPVVAHWGLESLADDLRDPLRREHAASDAFWVLMRRIKIFASLRHGELSRPRMEARVNTIAAWQ